MSKKNILLFGGTAESTEISEHILSLGHKLTLSTVSNDQELIHSDIIINRITGKLDKDQIISYINSNSIDTVICAVHPYATQARENIIHACDKSDTQLLVYMREDSKLSTLSNELEIFYASDHIQASKIANSFHGNILLTTGSRNLEPYMSNIDNSSKRIFARVLNCPESETALQNAGISPSNSVLARGPFSEEDNIRLIKRFNITTLITKDGGNKGGTQEKLIAAQKTMCKIILITRPEATEDCYTSISELVNSLNNL